MKELLQRGTVEELPLKAATISELKSLCLALLDNVNDKSLALSHQKRTNKYVFATDSHLDVSFRALKKKQQILVLNPFQAIGCENFRTGAAYSGPNWF